MTTLIISFEDKGTNMIKNSRLAYQLTVIAFISFLIGFTAFVYKEEVTSMLTPPSVKAQMSILQVENKQLLAANKELLTQLEVTKTSLSAAKKQLSEALVPESSLAEVAQNRVVNPLTTKVIIPLNNNVVEPTKQFFYTQVGNLKTSLEKYSVSYGH
jgi:hypothetical protein